MVTIVLADDHCIVRKALSALLRAERDFKVIGEAEDGLQAVDTIARLCPDVLVCSSTVPFLNAAEVARRVVRCSPHTRIVIISLYDEQDKEAYVAQALKSGAHACVLKASAPGELVTAIRQTLSGRLYLSPPLSEGTLQEYASETGAASAASYQRLTDREKEILYLLGEGLTRTEMAARFVISPRTVDTHCTNLRRKLRLQNHANLVLYAVNRGVTRSEN